MESTLEKIQFRLNQSREKIKLASIFLEKKKYCDSVLASYRAIFYAIRVLLVDKGIDSDDPDRIIEIFEKYLQSTLFGNTTIIEIARRSKEIKDFAVNSNGQIQYEQAEVMLNNATTILHEVERYYSH
ncbi:MAG TPA: HEPN domain-containing protein [Spirochaetota bacterium]|nr:HEPN domain-containing protein [Spirochaetota bacterium]